MKQERKWQTFWVISIGIFMSTLDGSILNIANPTIAENFHISMQQVQWVITAYMLAITALLIFLGRLGDQIGSQKVYRYGFLIFTAGSFLCSISFNLPLLITARVVQGVGASMMMATGMGIISNVFPAHERGKALGLSGMIVGIGNMTGPSLGGFLVANFAWPVIFLINVPIGLIGFYLALKFLPAQEPNRDQEVHDLAGTVSFGLSIGLLIYALSAGKEFSIIFLLAAFLLMMIFYYKEKNTPHPMLDFQLFKIKKFVHGNTMAMTVYTTQTSVFFLLPFFMERMLGFSPSYSGLLMTITPVTMALTAPLAGSLSDRVGSSKILVLSLSLLSCAYIVFSTLNNQVNLIKLAAGLTIMGLGMGMFGSPNNSSILGSIPREKAGYGGGFISTIRNLSFAVGTAGSVSIFSAILAASQKNLPYTRAYIYASHMVYQIAALITLIGLILALYNVGIERRKLNNSSI